MILWPQEILKITNLMFISSKGISYKSGVKMDLMFPSFKGRVMSDSICRL
jgi:hypothetical protein